ncbi:hypothetical protein ACFXJO_21540 [Streptomyces lavendulae]|uniref:hypothetical protein n=1 Tax=Streptomyces lavendulae TaxID=1914 RepID=UPI0036903B6C
MGNIIHKDRTTTVATAARGRASTAKAPEPVSRFLNELAHYLMVPSCPGPAARGGQR